MIINAQYKNMQLYPHSIKIGNLQLLLFTVVIFLINPIISILILGILYAVNNTKYLYILMSICVSLYLGLINTTKVPESDLSNYLYYFELAQVTYFTHYLAFFGKDIVFFAGTYILSHLLMSSEKLYIMILTFLIYYPVFIAIYKYWIKCDGRAYIILLGVFLLLGYQTFFGHSSHLIRQMIAGSFFIYFLINKALYGNNNWILMISAIFIHSSSVVLFAITFVPYINKKLNIYKFLIVSISVFLIIISWNQLLSIIGVLGSGIDAIEYGVERAANLDPYSDHRGFVIEGSFLNRRLIPLSLLIVAFLGYILKTREPKMFLVINTSIILILLLETLYIFGYYFLHVRYIVYTYFIYSFIYPYVFSYFKSSYISDGFKIITATISILMILNLFRYTVSSRWEYADVIELVVQPVIFYFI